MSKSGKRGGESFAQTVARDVLTAARDMDKQSETVVFHATNDYDYAPTSKTTQHKQNTHNAPKSKTTQNRKAIPTPPKTKPPEQSEHMSVLCIQDAKIVSLDVMFGFPLKKDPEPIHTEDNGSKQIP